MPDPSQAVSFYFFDFDDNIMFLQTRILVRHRRTQEPRAVSTQDFASLHPKLGKEAPWEHYETFDGTFRNFRDLPAGELKPGQRQPFVEDVEAAVASDTPAWKGPSWELFTYACQKQRPVSLVTARGHSPETLKAGIHVLVEKGLIPQAPNYLSLYPVGNDAVRQELRAGLSALPNNPLLDAALALADPTPAFKRLAIRKSVDQAIDEYGAGPEHRFGMSDDDPKNVDLIIKAMCDCKQKYLDQRFFVIDTHAGEHVKLEVFPVDYPVTGRPEIEPGERIR